MKTSLTILLMLLTAQGFAQKATAPEIRYEANMNPLRLPAGLYFGEVAGVAVNSKGHIFIYTRSGHTNPEGRVVMLGR